MAELRKVMLIEDEADIREVAKLSLEMVGGLYVEACSSGEEALQKMPAFAPDLVLLDVMMPGINGPTTLQRLRQQPELGSTPVVFMTAKVMQSELDEYRVLGAADVIPKPFDPMTLAERLKDVWRGLRD
jgi:CheY-like chemotaxis protein